MSWNERIRAALHGDVAGADIAAMLAAAAPLAGLREQLADRRLSAEIAHADEPWRVIAELAPIAAPLWLGENLAALAQSMCDGEAQSHPDRPDYLSPAGHAVAAAALQPIEGIVADVSAALVDPNRSAEITAPLGVGPHGVIAAFPLPTPVPAGYARGLLLAADRIHGAALVLLEDVRTLVQRATAPAWLSAAVQRLDGELSGASARLEMLRTRLASLLREPHPGDDALSSACMDLWTVLSTALVCGQMLGEPRLMPGAPPPARLAAPTRSAARPGFSAPSAGSPPHSSALPQHPTPPAVRPRAPEFERPAAMPDIAVLPQAAPPATPRAQPAQQRPAALPSSPPPGPEAPAPRPAAPEAMPEIGTAAPGPQPTRQDAAPSLPDIGGAAPGPQPTRQGPAPIMPEIEGHQGGDESTPCELPQIGPG